MSAEPICEAADRDEPCAVRVRGHSLTTPGRPLLGVSDYCEAHRALFVEFRCWVGSDTQFDSARAALERRTH